VRTRLLTITLATVLALLGAVAVLAYARQANQRAVDGLKAETVMYALHQIPAGTSLSKAQAEGLLSTEKVPNSSLSTNSAIHSVTAENGHKVVGSAVPAGQVLLQNMLTTAADVAANGGFVIPKGMVAVTVNMCIAEAVAQYVTPNTNVAVFDTVAPSTVQRTCDADRPQIGGTIKNNGAATTLLVIKKAEVLAVGPNPNSQGTSTGSNVSVTTDPESSSSSSSSDEEVLVTLALDQADAERLILSAEVGLPYMALLGQDATMAFTPPVNLFQQPQQP